MVNGRSEIFCCGYVGEVAVRTAGVDSSDGETPGCQAMGVVSVQSRNNGRTAIDSGRELEQKLSARRVYERFCGGMDASAETVGRGTRMKIGDRCFVHGYIDEIRKDTVIVRNSGGYFGTNPGEVITVYDTAHPNWIPVSAKFPPEDEDVLLQFPSNQGVGYYEDGDWMINTGDGIYSIVGSNEEKPIAWMPLPSPYREGGQS